MAYSGGIVVSGSYAIRDLWSYVVRFIVDNGWSLVGGGFDTNGVYTYSISQTLTVNALDTWLDLVSVSAYNEVVKKAGITLTRGIDYVINNQLGRIKLLSGGQVAVGDTVDISYTFKKEFFVFFSSGYSGDEKIYIGMMPYINPDGVNGYLQFKAFKYWQPGVAFTDTSLGNHNENAIALWNSDMKFWLFVNPLRVVLVARVQTYYSSAYVGFINRFALPHEYRYPLCVLSSDRVNMSYADTSNIRHFIIDARIGSFMDETAIWKNFASEYYSYLPIRLLPIQIDYDASNQMIQVHYPPNANVALWPVYVYANGNCYGQLDEVYFVPGTPFGSEAEITIGADKYIIFEDVFRHNWAQFMAIKEA